MSKAIISSDLFADYSSPTFVRWYNGTANTSYKAGLTYGQEGFALVFGKISNYHTVIAWLKGGKNMWAHYVSQGTDYGWSEYAQKSDLSNFIIEKNFSGSVDIPSGDTYATVECEVEYNVPSGYRTLCVTKGIVVNRTCFVYNVFLDNGKAHIVISNADGKPKTVTAYAFLLFVKS